MIRALGILAILFLATSCAPSASTTTLTSADNGRAINLATGDELIVQLDGNPTTGFDWTLAAAPTPALQQLERTFAPQSSALGAGGTVRYRFRAASPGTTKLTLHYLRSFESVPPASTFEVTVTVAQR